jgi:hypothetical protein
MSQRFLFYILDALFFSWAFPVILLLAIFFGLVLILMPVYLPNIQSRIIRFLWISVPALFGILWAFLAYVFKKPDWDSNLSAQLLVYPFQALFAPAILRHVLVAAFVFWVAYRLAAWYLDDIFELENLSVAEGFVLQAALGSGYSMITIKEGGVAPEQRESPLVRIGGPGWVRVNLDNAALFEESEGESRIIGPTGVRRHDAVALGAFERLRDVFDLRDQIEDLSVEARTSDGILVRADDVRVAFSVYRGNRESTLEEPYPYDEESLRQLFYNLERGAVNLAMISLIRRELGKFISQHCLNDFLTSAGDAVEGVGQAQGNGGTAAENAPPPGFFTRPEILSDLFAAQFARSARRNGVELKWIGVGTWVTPELIAQRHREAWRLSQENQLRGSEPELRRVRRESETAEFLRLVQEVPLLTFRRNQELSTMERMRRLVIAYYDGLSFGRFVRKHPHLKGYLTDLLIGDLFEDKVDAVWGPLEEFRAEEEARKATMASAS